MGKLKENTSCFEVTSVGKRRLHVRFRGYSVLAAHILRLQCHLYTHTDTHEYNQQKKKEICAENFIMCYTKKNLICIPCLWQLSPRNIY